MATQGDNVKRLYQRIDAMIDRVVDSESFLSKRGRLQPVRLKAILEILRGYIAVAAVFYAASAIVKYENSLSPSAMVLYGVFLATGFFLMVQTVYLLFTGAARVVLALMEPREAVRFTRRLRGKSRWAKGLVYAGGFALLVLYWQLLNTLLSTLAHMAFKT